MQPPNLVVKIIHFAVVLALMVFLNNLCLETYYPQLLFPHLSRTSSALMWSLVQIGAVLLLAVE